VGLRLLTSSTAERLNEYVAFTLFQPANNQLFNIPSVSSDVSSSHVSIVAVGTSFNVVLSPNTPSWRAAT
jgi:hypothetical protein